MLMPVVQIGRVAKSISTVRRREGNARHPIEDHRGVNRFDPDEVEQVALGSTAGGSSARQSRTSEWFSDERRRFPPEAPAPDAELIVDDHQKARKIR